MKTQRFDSKTSAQFFELICSGLWGRKADAEMFRDGADWNTICKIASMQTLSVILADGINTLPKELMPPSPIAFRLHSALTGTEQAHKKLNGTLAEAVILLKEHDIGSVLLKGQGIAQNYIVPEHRMCGDIDLYVGPENYEMACQVLDGFGKKDGHESESEKHFHFERNGVTIEIHRHSHVEANPSLNRKYNRWSDDLLLGKTGTLRSMQTCGVSIDLPPVEFDTMFIYYHLVHHLITGGIGLRQICDWCRHLHVYKDEINTDDISRSLSIYGSIGTWRVIGYIAVHYLGLPQEDMPFYSAGYTTKAARCIDIILRKGNFGRYAEEAGRNMHIFFLFRKIQSCLITLRSEIELLRIAPKEVLQFTPWYIIDGLKRIVEK